ncbi:hypothetical protein F8388_023657 [Cannabis sativa]|uniref:Ubiquitin-like protease family profile domain-containing protein n=1 Tax=Cannabis sativa TaxID=3483 RepID=A0A7J6GBQ8_CANSA|nr:hypothetical protein F8388_023657 [Cannabis sativa]
MNSDMKTKNRPTSMKNKNNPWQMKTKNRPTSMKNKNNPWKMNTRNRGSLIKKLHSSNNSKGKEKCKGKEKIVEHLDSTKSYEKFIAGVLDKTHISLQAICIWENLNQRQKELYKFYDIELLSYNNEQDKVIAINQLSIWLNTMTHVGQYYFIPWNIGKHWMLIIAMTSGRVVFLNPLKSKIPSDIAQMIKAAYANISSNAIVFGKNGPEIWTFACPKQPYNYECGYYVLTYIRDMLQHSNPIEAIKAKFGGLSQYSEDDHLLPLRQQWLNSNPSQVQTSLKILCGLHWYREEQGIRTINQKQECTSQTDAGRYWEFSQDVDGVVTGPVVAAAPPLQEMVIPRETCIINLLMLLLRKVGIYIL